MNDGAVPTGALTPATFSLAVARLVATDPVLSGTVERWGPPPFWRHPEGFAGLVHGILAQQVSLESAVAGSLVMAERDTALAIAVQELWDWPELPTWDALDAFAERWRPQRAVAARFLWHAYLSKRGRTTGGAA